MNSQLYFLPVLLTAFVEGKLINKNSTAISSTLTPVTGNQECAARARVLTVEANAVLEPDNSTVYGNVRFSQTNGSGVVYIYGAIGGLKPGDHGLHIHALGNIGDSCEGAGDHFNPDNFTHAGLTNAKRHAGDLGNINANEAGVAFVNLKTSAFTLNGDYTVIGRTLVVHEKKDDLGTGKASDSKTTGNSGSRLACGIIGIVDELENVDQNTLAYRYPYKSERQTKPNRSKKLRQRSSGNQIAFSVVFIVTPLALSFRTLFHTF